MKVIWQVRDELPRRPSTVLFVKTLPKLAKGRCLWIANSYYHLLLSSLVPLLNRSTLIKATSLQFINAWVKTNSHPSAERCGPRRGGIMASVRLAVWGKTQVTAATTLQLTWSLWPRWGANHISFYATHSPPLEQEEKVVLNLLCWWCRGSRAHLI